MSMARMVHWSEIRFSLHARDRARQRSIRDTDLMLLISVADCETPVGSGCIALSLSRRRRRELLAEGYQPNSVDRIARIAMVQSADGEIVTILRPDGYRGRRYRKAFQFHRPKMPKCA